MFKKTGRAFLKLFGVTDEMIARSKAQKKKEESKPFPSSSQRDMSSNSEHIESQTNDHTKCEDARLAENIKKNDLDNIEKQKIINNIKRIVSEINFEDNKDKKEEKLMKAGDDAEISLRNEILKHENFFGCRIWTNKRVKKFFGDRGPNEIDIIVLSPKKLYTFECKNISGTLMINPNTCDQKNRWVIFKVAYGNDKFLNDDTKVKLNEDICELLKLKTEKLQNYLLEKNIGIPDTCFESKVVFMNPNFKINDDQLTLFFGDIITYKNLQTYLEKQNISDYRHMISALVELCLNHEKDNIKEEKGFLFKEFSRGLNDNTEIIQVIDSLPSWDYVYLYGGGRKRCDIRFLKQIFLNPPSEEILNDIGRIKVLAPRSASEADTGRFNELLKLNLYDKNGKYIMSCNGDYIKNRPLSYNPAGHPEIARKFLYEIDEILLNGLYRAEEDC
ncbi:MAG: hypothetical protein BWK80_15005 [Desulfobacteraceae bacterium IS3]|nr:MAG: hypothetical protein BWK80_15005 [Desulfobacteraceae bacterium IS3]